jgi:hypothetical protein
MAPDGLASRTGSGTASAFLGGHGPNEETFARKSPRSTSGPPKRGVAVTQTNASGIALPAALVKSGKSQPAAGCGQADHTSASASTAARMPSPPAIEGQR